MKQSLAIIGGGVAGLTFAVKVAKMACLNIKIFQKQSYFGGRMLSHQIDKETIADLGANIIDFQSKEQENKIRQFLKDANKHDTYQDKLIRFKQPFLIYQKQLKKGDYHKDRYFYKQGFKGLIKDLVNQLIPQQFQMNYQVDTLVKQNNTWKIIGKNKQQYHSSFDYMVFAMSGPHDLEIMRKSELKQKLNLVHLNKILSNVQYTTQISAAFEIAQCPSFSCILFKNQNVAFMSCHKQKYQNNNKDIVVIQFNHQFSLLNADKKQQELATILLEAIPSSMKKWVRKCIFIKKWSPSLIKNKQQVDFTKFQCLQQKLLIVGDICNGSSRVTGAMETSIQVFNLLKGAYSSKI